jgi:hypothetical protein
LEAGVLRVKSRRWLLAAAVLPLLLGVWFLYQLIEASFGLFSASANGGGVAFFAHAGGFVFGLVVTGLLDGTSRIPGATALRCGARGILPSPRRKTQDAEAEMRIGFVSGKIKTGISYQY